MTNVILHAGFTPTSFPISLSCKNFLEQQGIRYTFYPYVENQHSSVLINSSLWIHGQNRQQRTITDFPIIQWLEHYADDTSCHNVALTLDELKQSNLILYKNKVVQNG